MGHEELRTSGVGASGMQYWIDVLDISAWRKAQPLRSGENREITEIVRHGYWIKE